MGVRLINNLAELDDPKVYQRYDPAGMRQFLRELPQECQRAWQRMLNFLLPPDYGAVDKVVILGIGGSAIGGDLARSLVLLEGRGQVWVQRDYDLPPLVDAHALVIASSYSGNTEETLTAFRASLKTPARKLAITTGGKLRELAEEKGIPVFRIDYSAPPRAAFAHSFIPLLGVFQKLGWLKDKTAEMEEMVRMLKELGANYVETSPLALNPAKQLASRLWGRLTVIYGAGFLSEVARRWKTQINENSKAWAFYELLPELNHNAVVGYEYPQSIAEKVQVILLRSPALSLRLLLRYQLTAEILSQKGISSELVEAKGETPLSQMMSLVLLGDYVSYYLAILNQADPSPVKVIDYLKQRLAQS